MMKQLVVLLILNLFFLASCKKDNSGSSSDPMNLLTRKSWKYVLEDKNPGTNPVTGSNLYYAVPDCEKDNILQFNIDGKLKESFGSSKCEEGQSDSRAVDYSIDTEGRSITINDVRYELLELSENQLKYSSPVPSGGNIIFMFGH